MKHRFFAICLILILLFSLLPAQAENLGFFTDAAGLLSDDQAAALENLSAEISEQYQCGIYTVIVENFSDGYSGSIYEFAKAVYRQYDLGFGNEADGILLLLSMSGRDYSIIVCGDNACRAVTDAGRGTIEDAFLDDFSHDNWYDGFYDYIEQTRYLLQLDKNGEPYGAYAPGNSASGGVSFLSLFLCLCFGALTALIVTAILRKKMKTAVSAKEASAYITADGVEIFERADIFTHTTETRERINREDSHNGTSRDSDGFSGSSGKF